MNNGSCHTCDDSTHHVQDNQFHLRYCGASVSTTYLCCNVQQRTCSDATFQNQPISTDAKQYSQRGEGNGHDYDDFHDDYVDNHDVDQDEEEDDDDIVLAIISVSLFALPFPSAHHLHLEHLIAALFIW